MDAFVIKLYVAGQTGRSAQSVANLRQLCDSVLRGRCSVSIVDVLERPDLAEADRIIATPTLVKVAPLPQRRVIGDLSHPTHVLEALGIRV